jgi:hypothetical protein
MTIFYRGKLGSNYVFWNNTENAPFGVTDIIVVNSPVLTASSVDSPINALNGLSGSLQTLSDGSPYLLAGTNITIVTNSFGQIEITGSVTSVNPGGSDGQIQYNNSGSFGGLNVLTFTNGNLFSTGSFKGTLDGTSSLATNSLTASYVLQAVSSSFASTALTASFVQNAVSASFATNALTASYALNAISSSFASEALTASYASNSDLLDNLNSTDFARLTVSNVFTANQVITGSVIATTGFSGSLTTLTDGSPYLIAGTNITLSTGSNGEITINTSGNINNVFWQSNVSNQIFTTGSIAITGSITGSNLVLNAPASRILAPNGVLVISSSAGTFITGSFVVSGTRSDLGTENTSVLFDGDLFVSGGIGLNDYLQLKPVQALRIPTNTTASYIYTSGSTNDMYFTQYQPGTGFTNTTRLRWLESYLSTGLLHGGLLSTQNGTTTFSITSGSGIVLKYNASVTSDPYPTIIYVQWPAYVSQSLPSSGSAQITYVGITTSGTLFQQVTPFVDSDYQEIINIGRVLHQSGSVTNGTITAPTVAYGQPTWTSIFTRAIGPLKTTGHVLAASGSTLGLTKTAGNSYVEGRNYSTNTNSPNSILSSTDTAVTISKIYREHVSGSTPIIDTGIANAGYTVIDPTLYNLNGTLAAVDPNKVTVQRVYWFPNSVNKAFFVYYGPQQYASLDLAQAAISEENFIEGANTAGAAILVAYILVDSNCTSLLNTAKARILQAGPFRGSAAGGGSVAGTTNPGGADTYVQFNDGGIFGGVAGLTFNKTSNTLSTTNLAVSNIATVSGSVILGDSASDIITITGQLTASNGLRAAGVSTFAANTSFTGSVGYFGINIVNTADATLILSGTDTRGGAGYYNFLYVSNSYSASVNRVKNFRVASDGNFEIISSDYATNIFALSDTGTLTIPGGYLASKASSFFGVKEKFNTKSGATGTVVHDCSTGHIFYHSGATANWTSNFTNLSMSNGYATTITLVVTQSSNAYIPSAIQLDGVGQTLNWQGNVTPTGTASRRDVISFSILNVSSSYIVLGQFVSF